jgi:cytidyltransferase-like protein
MSDLFNSIDELIFELEDEDSDPVGGRTIAIVPGAFKPPHLGHLDMVRQYAEQADEVVVLISSPIKSGRFVNGKPITAEQSEQIWKMLIKDQGLSDVVDVKISKIPSPITATFKEIGEDGSLEPGTRLILGASKKGGDFKRWKGAAKYVKPGVELLSPEETAVMPAKHSDAYGALLSAEQEKQSELFNNMPSVKSRKDPMEFHASDFRFVLEQSAKNNVARKMLENFVGKQNVEGILDMFGLKSIEEMSAMGGGAVQGYGAPLGTRKRKKKQSEYNELYLYKEVLKLLMKEGIVK